MPCALRRRPAASRRRFLLHPVQPSPVGADPGADVPVDGVNFGFLLMAMDRLRNEVADLALLDDLTGVGNRRHLLQRLTEECARSERSGEPFALLVIDLDGFKAHQRHPWPCRRRRLPAALHPDGADPVAARRHAGAHRRRRVLHRAAVLDAARGRDDRPPHARRLPRGRRSMRGQRYPDLGLDRRGAMDPRRWAPSRTG